MKKSLLTIVAIILTLSVFVFAVLWKNFVGCNIWQQQCLFPGTHIALEVDVVEGETPLTVNYKKVYENVRRHHPYYWCFDTVTIEKTPEGEAVQLTENTCIKERKPENVLEEWTETTTKTYTEPGTYTRQFGLSRGTKPFLLSNTITVTVK